MMTEARQLADRLRYLSQNQVGLKELLEIVDSLPRIVAVLDLVASPIEQPRYFTGCLRDGVCRGVCRNFDCPNYDLVVAARLCVFPKEDEILYPTTEGMK